MRIRFNSLNELAEGLVAFAKSQGHEVIVMLWGRALTVSPSSTVSELCEDYRRQTG